MNFIPPAIYIVEGPQRSGKTSLIKGLTKVLDHAITLKKVPINYRSGDPLLLATRALADDLHLLQTASALRARQPELTILIDRCLLSNMVYTVLRENGDSERLFELFTFGGFSTLLDDFLREGAGVNRIILMEPFPLMDHSPSPRPEKAVFWKDWTAVDQSLYRDVVQFIYADTRLKQGLTVLSPDDLTESKELEVDLALLLAATGV